MRMLRDGGMRVTFGSELWEVHTAIRRTDGLVENHERHPERRELDRRLGRLGVHLLWSQHLLATSPKAS